MASLDQPLPLSQAEARPQAGQRPADSLRFDLWVAVLCAWFVAGLFVDGWAHNNGRVDDSFLTPWHAVLYSGFAAVGALLVYSHFRNVQRGYAWLRALPQGYLLALFGVVLFGFGGGFDFVWHNTFGFEANIEALLSPAHLLLAAGAMLFVSAPLRAAWSRRGPSQGWRDLLPAILSLTYLLSLMTFFVQYSHFTNQPDVLVYRPGSSRGAWEVAIISGILIPTALMMGVFFYALRRWRLPFGSFTLILTANTAAMFFMRYGATQDYPLILLVGAAGGLLADGLAYQLRPSSANTGAARIFGFSVPFVMFLLYFFVINISGPNGLWWRVHMWLGVPFLAGIAGFLVSFLVMPPAVPVENPE